MKVKPLVYRVNRCNCGRLHYNCDVTCNTLWSIQRGFKGLSEYTHPTWSIFIYMYIVSLSLETSLFYFGNPPCELGNNPSCHSSGSATGMLRCHGRSNIFSREASFNGFRKVLKCDETTYYKNKYTCFTIQDFVPFFEDIIFLVKLMFQAFILSQILCKMN